jgi:hypothetical protein
MFIHQVCFWLKDGVAEPAVRQMIRDCHSLLARVPGVVHLWAGPPAMTPRPVVDNSYQVGLCIVLQDRPSHDVYQEHPLHKEFIARNQALWDHVRILDFVHGLAVKDG